MRLNEFEIDSIKTLASRHFGKGVHVYLFGSRTQDELLGGDIDLFISSNNDKLLEVRTKVNFIADLVLLIGDQKIDVVLDTPAKRNSVFFKTIYQTGIQLC